MLLLINFIRFTLVGEQRMPHLNVQLLLTGDELMSGDIVDSNSAMVAQQLKKLGLVVSRKVTVADNPTYLANEIQQMSQQADILIINGGLGPTVDDLTSEVLASVCKYPLSENKEALLHLEKWAQKKQTVLNRANLKQALLPSNAQIICNRVGSAVGIQCALNNCEIYCTPGVPSELKIMLAEEIIPHITQEFPDILSKQDVYDISRLHTYGIGESFLEELISKAIPHWSPDINLGFRAEAPLVEIKLTTQKTSSKDLKNEYLNKLTDLLGEHIVDAKNERPKPLAEYLIEILKSKNQTITTAESCTGGLIASQITEIAGSSQVFEAGFVTYSNTMKTKMLEVPAETLIEYGAVSEETVIAMAKGALKVSQANYAIAVSGIAGPTGGTPEKPLGSVWIAWGDENEIKTQYFCLSNTRQNFQKSVAARALDLLRRFIKCSSAEPFYIKSTSFKKINEKKPK